MVLSHYMCEGQNLNRRQSLIHSAVKQRQFNYLRMANPCIYKYYHESSVRIFLID